jgi:hypothetical protein
VIYPVMNIGHNKPVRQYLRAVRQAAEGLFYTLPDNTSSFLEVMRQSGGNLRFGSFLLVLPACGRVRPFLTDTIRASSGGLVLIVSTSVDRFGGEAGIRTPASLTTTNGLANRPLRPTWVLLHILTSAPSLINYGGETGIRTQGRLAPTPVFKTGALNQLDHLSVS